MPRIDTHHHFVPEKFKQYADKQSEWPSPNWSIDADKALCNKIDVKFSFLSLTTPGPGVGGTPELAIDIARDANLHAAEVAKQNPNSYGFFASIPPPISSDSEKQSSSCMAAALSEIKYAYDTLNADGVTLHSSYEGKYLGDAAFKPLWEDLNARGAVVFIHPTSPVGWKPANQYLLAPLADFAWETTRCALDMILNNVVRDVAPDCKIILSHAGGCLPWIWKRTAVASQIFPEMKKSVEEIQEDARSFWYDTALSGTSDVMTLLMSFARKERILFGSDFPYAGPKTVGVFTNGLDQTEMSDEMRERIAWRNGVELFPRLKEVFKA